MSEKEISTLEELQKNDFKPDYPQTVYSLFLFFALYIVMPLIDIPRQRVFFVSPSIFPWSSACLVETRPCWLADYSGWILMVVFIWAVFFFRALNGLLSGGKTD